MIVLRKTKFVTGDGHCVELYADSIDELELNSTTPPQISIVGLNKTVKLMPSSFCFDSDGRKAVYTSSGIWKELKEGGTEDDEIVNALKDYYVAIGGNAEDVANVNTIYDMIEAISAISGSGLPDVDTEDEGDVLTVNNEGKWDKAVIPSQLPAVTADDNGDILAVVEGAWAKKTPETPSINYVIIDDNTTAAELIDIIDNKIPAVVRVSNKNYAVVNKYDSGARPTRFLTASYAYVDSNDGSIELTTIAYKMTETTSYTKYTSNKTIL